MKKNSLTPNKGLSLSQAQSISNLCNQRAREIDANLTGINNYSKSIDVPMNNGTTKVRTLVVGKELPTNVVSLLKEKSALHACQAFLMENIKAKDALLKDVKKATPDFSTIEEPERPKTVSPLLKQLSEVGEEFGWSQLSVAEVNEYFEAEAFASHIGQFIHKDGLLDNLRTELPRVSPIEWMTIVDGIKTPVDITTHHTAAQLLKVHEELAAIHRGYEQRVNYFKAKVKNLTTEENARIAKNNADAQNDAEKINKELQTQFQTAYLAYTEKMRSIQAEFEKVRQAKTKKIAAMRIEVDNRFQSIVDVFLNQLSAE